jgi:hypothetical protein
MPGIYWWMHASLPGCRPGICMKIPAAPLRASSIGCRVADDAAGPAKREHAIVAQLPDPTLWIPSRAGRLRLIAGGHVGKGDAHRNDAVVGRARRLRFPAALSDEELHGSDPLAPLGIVAGAHADEAITAVRGKSLASVLTRFQMEPRRAAEPGAQRWRGTGGASCARSTRHGKAGRGPRADRRRTQIRADGARTAPGPRAETP